MVNCWAPTTLAFVALGSVACARARGEVAQPIKFNHQIHVSKEIECDTCHEHAEESLYAGIPRNDVCLGCHTSQLGKDPEEGRFLALAARGPIPWIRVNRLPGHVYFSHQAHVAFGDMDCKGCHGDMAQRTAPVGRSQIENLTMSACIACHEQKHARSDCLTCHK